mmetsp:Transcript_13736/g.27157  ORF Transcript_13736/g.27157 Transcript_13736/m.27157 type:complete len:177 (+) Transcript_13736:37-567(+)|eukprot:CAMPEP_0173390700 /NCGR_PEP_ID=MMETSP1356-20130122/15857_1 /TAXON_ID=77927 ORGANISM="Hemiselmis virescens, Strain PCC157" /NCGR_SAMPLE_ID=MMETSP1356 /ASSEMBLY_ACC=CAM_ASM_000847 /LENGTH=176 /DNA_ID=CAMNT_0014348157 /DNA_START=35 /DNA_END=565 /DNA_ORIENTATION=+
MFEDRPIRVAAASLRGWISGGNTPSVAWISDVGHSSSFRWPSALVVVGVGLVGVVVARRLLSGPLASKGEGTEHRGAHAANQGHSPTKTGAGLDDSFEGIDEEGWDSISAPRDIQQNPLEASAVLIPLKPSANLEKSVVMVGHPDLESAADDSQADRAGRGDKGGSRWLARLNPFS